MIFLATYTMIHPKLSEPHGIVNINNLQIIKIVKCKD